MTVSVHVLANVATSAWKCGNDRIYPRSGERSYFEGICLLGAGDVFSIGIPKRINRLV